MNPRLLSFLRFILAPGLPLPEGFEPVSEHAATEEMREILAGLNLKRTVFRANHVSIAAPLSGRLPADKEKLLSLLDAELSGNALDRVGQGVLPPFL